MTLTYKEKQQIMTTFAKDIFLDVQTIKRVDGTFITVSRSNKILSVR